MRKQNFSREFVCFFLCLESMRNRNVRAIIVVSLFGIDEK